jgi:hypothetical protein
MFAEAYNYALCSCDFVHIDIISYYAAFRSDVSAPAADTRVLCRSTSSTSSVVHP